MSASERRNSVRKICTLPLRFRVNGNGHGDRAEGMATGNQAVAAGPAAQRADFVGKALNLSERGVYFTCRENLSIGQAIEMYFTLPSELTGRAPENVRCSARVVHVDEDGQAGLRGIGASVEQFEPVAAIRNWSN
jgi:hypothetical protein